MIGWQLCRKTQLLSTFVNKSESFFGDRLNKHLLQRPFLEGLSAGDLLGHAFDLSVERAEEVGDLGLFL